MSGRYILYIKIDSGLPNEIYQYYNKLTETSITSEDSGIDLPLIDNYKINDTKCETFNFGIKCEMRDSNGNSIPYYLYSRSSISKTPLIQLSISPSKTTIKIAKESTTYWITFLKNHYPHYLPSAEIHSNTDDTNTITLHHEK